MKPILSLLALAIFLGPHSAHADDYPRDNMLVEVAAAAKTKKYLILDARSREQYEAGHIPGAVFVNHANWSKIFATEQDAGEWGARIGSLGITPTTPILVYDDALQKDAARIWWILRTFGTKDVRLLNGGWTAWTAANLPTSKDAPQVIAVDFQTAIDLNRFADKQKVFEVIKEKTAQLVDARSEKEYCGDTFLAKKAGSIPGAVHLEWSDALDTTTQKFKTAGELTALLKQAGIDVKRRTVTHCQSGGRAAVMAFTLELMGADAVANYYRGWSEWGNLDDTPIATPKKK